MNTSISSRNEALTQFEYARRQAQRELRTSRWQGRDTRMIPFDAIRAELRQQNPLYRGIQDIELNLVVGSVGRAHEFTRHFLPLNDGLRERWIGIEQLAKDQGWPPIEVFQVGNVYFAKDGNHRLSVARQMEMTTVEAHVWVFPEDVEIDPEASLEDVLIQLEERDFLKKTKIDQRIPDYGIRFTVPGNYTELLAQIENLRETLAQIDGERMPYYDAVDAWHEMILLPTIQIIQDSTLLSDFPGRTEADLFVWMSKHREGLCYKYGEVTHLADLAGLMAAEFKESGVSKIVRQVRRLLGEDVLPPLADSKIAGTNIEE